MKNTKKSFIITIAIMALISLTFTGCITDQSAQQQATNQAILGAAVTTAATFGTQYDLQRQGGMADLPYFIAAQQALNTVATGTNTVTSASINAALAASGNGSSAANPAIATAIGAAVNLVATAIQNQGTNAPQQAIILRAAAGWIANGIAAGLPPPGGSPQLMPPTIFK